MPSALLADPIEAARVFTYVESAQAAQSMLTLDAATAEVLSHFGLEWFIQVDARDRRGRVGAALLNGRSNADWRNHYIEGGWPERDPLLRACLDMAEPVTWRRGLAVARSEDEIRLFEEARAFGLADGFFLPIHRLDGSVQAVSLFAGRPLEIDPRASGALHLVALYYAAAANRLADQSRRATSEVQLTGRQRECLQWVRAGKTDWEISQILGLSEHTVIEHLEAARRRLGVRTRTQAVIEAIALGLIHL
jgi:DNA-binding CsgD family transcriptional regulator